MAQTPQQRIDAAEAVIRRALAIKYDRLNVDDRPDPTTVRSRMELRALAKALIAAGVITATDLQTALAAELEAFRDQEAAYLKQQIQVDPTKGG